MEVVRCVIGDIPQRILADIVQNIAEEDGAIEIVGRVDRIEEAASIISESMIDVVILGVQKIELPHPVVDEIRSIASLPIICLGNDGRQVGVYLDNIGRTDMVNIIQVLRSSGRRSTP